MENPPNAEQVYLAGLEANTQREANRNVRRQFLRNSALNIFTKQNFARQTRNLGKAWKGINKYNLKRATGMLHNISTWSLEKLQTEIERLWKPMRAEERGRRFYAFLHQNPRMPEPLNRSYFSRVQSHYAIDAFLRHWIAGDPDERDFFRALAPPPLLPTRLFDEMLNSAIIHDLTGAWPNYPGKSVQYLMWRDANLRTIYELMFEALTRPLGGYGGGKKKSRKSHKNRK